MGTQRPLGVVNAGGFAKKLGGCAPDRVRSLGALSPVLCVDKQDKLGPKSIMKPGGSPTPVTQEQAF